MSDSKKTMTLHVVIGYLRGTIESEYRTKVEREYAKELLNVIEDELKEKNS